MIRPQSHWSFSISGTFLLYRKALRSIFSVLICVISEVLARFSLACSRIVLIDGIG